MGLPGRYHAQFLLSGDPAFFELRDELEGVLAHLEQLLNAAVATSCVERIDLGSGEVLERVPLKNGGVRVQEEAALGGGVVMVDDSRRHGGPAPAVMVVRLEEVVLGFRGRSRYRVNGVAERDRAEILLEVGGERLHPGRVEGVVVLLDDAAEGGVRVVFRPAATVRRLDHVLLVHWVHGGVRPACVKGVRAQPRVQRRDDLKSLFLGLGVGVLIGAVLQVVAAVLMLLLLMLLKHLVAVIDEKALIARDHSHQRFARLVRRGDGLRRLFGARSATASRFRA